MVSPPPRMDADSFLALLRPHYDDALRYCRGIGATGSLADTEDAFQSALLRAFENVDRLREPERFRPWLFQIVTREVRRSQRRRWWRDVSPLPSDDGPPPLGLVVACETGDALDVLAALSRLGDQERQALLLFEIGGFSVDEIREIQRDRSPSAVKSRLSRARARLRALLTDTVPAPSSP